MLSCLAVVYKFKRRHEYEQGRSSKTKCVFLKKISQFLKANAFFSIKMNANSLGSAT